MSVPPQGPPNGPPPQPGQQPYGPQQPHQGFGFAPGYPPQGFPPGQPQTGYPQPQHPQGFAPGYPPAPTPDERQTAMWCHLGLALFGLLVPLIFFLTNPSSPFVRENVRNALNFGLTCFGANLIITIVSIPLMFVLVGMFTIFLVFVVVIAALVLGIMAAMAANRGEVYRYPMAIELVK